MENRYITVVKNKTDLPIFYNSVITNRIVNELSINPNEPYVFIETIEILINYMLQKCKNI